MLSLKMFVTTLLDLEPMATYVNIREGPDNSCFLSFTSVNSGPVCKLSIQHPIQTYLAVIIILAFLFYKFIPLLVFCQEFLKLKLT